MEERIEPEKMFGLPPIPPLNVGIAIDGKRKSKYLVNWALEKFIPEENVAFKLLHVRPMITTVPTAMGNSIPISQVRDDVAAAYKQEMGWQTNQMLLPFKNLCTRNKVQVDVVVIESDDVAEALAEEVAKGAIKKLVIGASPRGMFTRKLKLSSQISDCTPSFCTVYAVSKGKLTSVRPSDLETIGSMRDDTSVASSTNSSSSCTSSSQTDATSVASYTPFHSPSLLMQRNQALSTINQGLLHTRTNSVETNHSRCQSLDIDGNQSHANTRTNFVETTNHSRWQSMDIEEENCEATSNPSGPETEHTVARSSSCKNMPTDYQSWEADQASTSDALTDYSSSDGQAIINFELEKLRIELRHVRGIYAMAQSEAIDASRKLNNLSKRHSEEAIKLKEINVREKEAEELARQEKEKSEAAIREAEYIRECAEREASQREEAELEAIRDAKEKEKLENALSGQVQQYHMFSWEEIVSATSSFSEDLKIGMGAYGTVYKCSLHHTTAAVKVLHSKENPNSKQFLQELEILSKIRHPHLLILIGACPEHGCLVYEYMENGSLDDRLFRVNNTPSIPWYERYRIAWEVASALAFLHNSKPKPIIHRDLKPANILLDHNFVSKIGDVGLSTMLNSDASFTTTMYRDTGPVGTLCYIDPEYQRSGLVSPKSDVYAFGILILQLVTAKHAIALTHIMETAIDDGRLSEMLDSRAGKWPLEETKELVLLGLSCAEMRRRDRPDLKNQVLPTLERLKEVADRARDSISRVQRRTPPNHFICPILKDIMLDPCVAADGYSYDRKAIEKWLEDNDKSPMTNLPLASKNLLPSYTLLSAIIEWKSNKQ
ncbi:U-box domain-containing protein 35-like isoform X2 [Mercurialis annua]|uniref:U-box domain-containing protein 35-like isoform X2 n=1 Tax=Mercurialis annua TaxID=3986 RepID=UPI00215EE0C4|nr:U-box domain-containing protein 35-like isoform X2 [Mercurialis annua]